MSMSATERCRWIDSQRCPHSEDARQETDHEDDAAQDQHVVRLKHDTAREVVLDWRSAAPRRRNRVIPAPAPVAQSCHNGAIGAPISFSVAIWLSFSIVMV